MGIGDSSGLDNGDCIAYARHLRVAECVNGLSGDRRAKDCPCSGYWRTVDLNDGDIGVIAGVDRQLGVGVKGTSLK